MKLNLGCGKNPKEGFVNIDYKPGEGVDIVYDLNVLPLDFEDNSVDFVLASYIFEHLKEWTEMVKEIHRILKPGGFLKVRVPYGNASNINCCAFHRWVFFPNTINAFLVGPKARRGLDSDICPKFTLCSRKIRYRFPFTWHLNHYLRIKLPEIYDFPLGERNEIEWIVSKVQTDTFDGIR